LIPLGKVKRLLFIVLLVGLVWGHNRLHIPLTPYISPGIQIGYNDSRTFFLSYQLTIGVGFKNASDHFEDTTPLLLGRTFGVRRYYQKEKPVVVYKYYDTQISFMLGGIGIGKLINSKGESFKKNKYWVGAFGLLTYEKVFFDDKVEKQYGLFGVFPLPIFQILNN
tara:strand:- start:97 stop:594 length:498 start_codon:yes stop_codon:yes gene_type:complete